MSLFNDCEKRFRIVIVLWLTITSAYCFIHQTQFRNAMAVSRLDLLHALVSHKTFAIDVYEKNTDDKSSNGTHYYCDKAPGIAFLAFPSFYLSAKIMPIFGIALDSPKGWLISSWFCVAASLSIITSSGAVCLFLWLLGFVPQRIALLSTLVFAFGSMAFPYATMLMSHAVVMGLFAIALWLLQLGYNPLKKQNEGKQIRSRVFFGGTACGLAIACEYDAALVAGGILALVFCSDLKRGCLLILGAIPPILLIPIYDWICTGNPFSLPYGHEVVFTAMDKGFYGIYLPDGMNALELLLGPTRGLFFWTPFLLLAFVGYPTLYDKSKPLFYLCYGIPFIHVVAISGFYSIQGGLTLGPRYLAPILPLLILPAGIGAIKIPRIAVLLGILSIIATGGGTLIDALPTEDNPLFNFYIPRLLKGECTYNLGELIGLRHFWGLLPLLLLIVMSIWYLWRQCRPMQDERKSSGGSRQWRQA